MTDSYCSLQEIPILSYLPDSYKVRSGPGVSGRRVAKPSYETSFPKLELVQSRGTLHFVGWVEPTPDFVRFRCTQPNLHFAGSNA